LPPAGRVAPNQFVTFDLRGQGVITTQRCFAGRGGGGMPPALSEAPVRREGGACSGPVLKHQSIMPPAPLNEILWARNLGPPGSYVQGYAAAAYA